MSSGCRETQDHTAIAPIMHSGPGNASRPEAIVATAPIRLCIVAQKNLQWNTRIVRQAKVLCEAGHQVTVVCLEPPHPKVRKSAPDARFIVVNMQVSPLAKLRQRLRLVRKQIATFGNPPALLSGKPVQANVMGASEQARERSPPFAMAVNGALDALVPLNTMLRARQFSRAVLSALDGEQFDCVQAHDSYSLSAVSRLSHRTGAAVVFDAVEIPTDRSGWVQAGASNWLLKVEDSINARVIRKAGRIITVSNGLADWLREHYGVEDLVVIRNCRLYEDYEKNDRIRRDAGLRDSDHLVLYLNSLYEGQGLEQLVDAFEYLPSDVHIATLGPMPQPRLVLELRERAARLGACDRFHVLEPKPASEMLVYASGADIGVIPRQDTSLNNRISLPNRVFELVMARLPIAGPSLPDMSNLIGEHGLGLCFDEKDPRDIARVVKRMLETDELARFRLAADEAAQSLCWENEGMRYRRSVESLFGSPGVR